MGKGKGVQQKEPSSLSRAAARARALRSLSARWHLAGYIKASSKKNSRKVGRRTSLHWMTPTETRATSLSSESS
jgi:hypothetical protein